MIKPRPSRVLRKLRAGEVASIFKINLSCPRVADIAAACGYDCVWLCMEHTANDLSVIESQTYAAKSRDVDVLVRVPRGSYSHYIKPLELDATGIMVPHVMSLDDAKSIVAATRFHPLGLRAIDGGNADGVYCNVPVEEYIRHSNEEKFVAIQIEDTEPLDELDAICALEGLDMIFFGPGDFSHSIGVPGQMDHPRVIEVRRLVAETARKHGKYAATSVKPDDVEKVIDLGYSVIFVGADVVGLSKYCKEIVARVNHSPSAYPTVSGRG